MQKIKRLLIGACSINCGKCPIHLRTKEELNYWRNKKVDLNKIRCDGCRSNRKGHHWSSDCRILQCCVYKRKLEFCSQCKDFPCKILEEWGKEYEHHIIAIKNLAKMKRIGVEEYLESNPR
jgi:hypothetical protein